MKLYNLRGRRALRIAVEITILGLLLAGSANAATLAVCPSGCTYSGIQNAVNASSSGDTIEVQSGTYYENVNVNKQLTLRGIGMPVVDANRSRSAITLSADGITLEGFTVTGSRSGSFPYPPETGIKVNSNNNMLSGNNASNNRYGISLFGSSNNTLSGNIMTENAYNFDLSGSSDSDFNNHIDTSNLVDGRPIYYIIKASDMIYNSSINAETLYCISCINVTIKNLNLDKNGIGVFFWNTTGSRIQNVNTSNNSYGISLQSSSNNTLSSNNISNNGFGIYLDSSSNNMISDNDISNNIYYGISLWSLDNNNTLSSNNISNNTNGISFISSSNNNIYNNFINNIKNIDIDNESFSNIWNTTRISGINIIQGPYIGGNVWANPNSAGFSQTCKDVDNDGICDSPYTLDSNNIDYLPLAYRPLNILKGDLNNNGVPADAGDLVLMKRASIDGMQADSRYDLNSNGIYADAGDLVLMKRASIGEINL